MYLTNSTGELSPLEKVSFKILALLSVQSSQPQYRVAANAHTREHISREDRLIGRNIPKEHRLPPVQTWRAQNMFALLSNLQQFYLCHCTLT